MVGQEHWRHLENYQHDLKIESAASIDKQPYFIHKLYWSGGKDGWLREISDNDGGNTAYYLAAMTFKYAATGDEQARLQALDAFKAMTWLGDITGVPGFIAKGG